MNCMPYQNAGPEDRRFAVFRSWGAILQCETIAGLAPASGVFHEMTFAGRMVRASKKDPTSRPAETR